MALASMDASNHQTTTASFNPPKDTSSADAPNDGDRSIIKSIGLFCGAALLGTAFVGFWFLISGIFDEHFRSVPKEPYEKSEQLSWQSAMWAVAAIAITNMTDMSGGLCGYPRRLMPYLKSSPLVCLTDLFYTMATIIISIWTKSFKRGFHHAMLDLSFRKFGSQGTRQATRRPIRIILFVLGAMPQAIKLFASTGIPLSQFIAACYLLDFFNNELILLYAQRSIADYELDDLFPKIKLGHHENDTMPSKTDELIMNVVNMLNLACTNACLTRALFQEHYWTLYTLVFSCIAAWVWCMVYACIYDISDRLFSEAWVVSYPVAALIWWPVFWFSYSNLFDFHRFQSGLLKNISVMCYNITIAWMTPILFSLVGGFMWCVWLGSLWTAVMQCSPNKAKEFPSAAYTFLTAFTMVVYYTCLYDATQTHKFDWVEWLS